MRRKPWTGCDHPRGADRCLEPVYVTALRTGETARIRLCFGCAVELGDAGLLVTGSARRIATP